MAQRGAERSLGFGGVAAVFNCVREVRLQFFVDLAAQAIAAEYVRDA